MITIHIWGTPDNLDEEQMRELTQNLLDLVQDYKVRPEERTCVFFPSDRMKWGQGEEVMVEIHGAIYNVNSTNKVLTRSIVDAVAKYLPESWVECVVYQDAIKAKDYSLLTSR